MISIKKIYFRFLIIILLSLSVVFPVLAGESNYSSSQLVGSWKVYKDDDRPNGGIPNEVMSFWLNGKFEINGDIPHKGLYRVADNQLEMLVKIGDRGLAVSRQFELLENELKFKNEKVGWVYYIRISDKPNTSEPDLS